MYYLRPFRTCILKKLFNEYLISNFCCNLHTRSLISVLSSCHVSRISRNFSNLPLNVNSLCYSSSEFDSELKSHNCGELRSADVGSHVRLRGFLQYQRMGKFCILRDAFGITQVLINNENFSALLKSTPYESYIEVTGEVNLRPEDQLNKHLATGEIEVVAQQLVVLNSARKDIPFLIRERNKPTEQLGLKYRYLDLRHSYLQHNIRFRSKIGKKMRDYLQDVRGFVEIITPTLSVATPGGAQEFVVPSRTKDHFYSLVQSPQTYKQLAVIGGFEKYFQFAICYRDEGGKVDRQPEFMQLDLEVADMTANEIRKLVEQTIRFSWPDDLPRLEFQFPVMSYEQAMHEYGVDKPDTRFDWKISDVSELVSSANVQLFEGEVGEGNVTKAFVVPQGKQYIKKSHYRAWRDISLKEFGLTSIDIISSNDGFVLRRVSSGQKLPKTLSQYLVKQLNTSVGDSIVISHGVDSKVLKLLGKLRLLSAEVLESGGVQVRDSERFDFLWVVDFPMFERNERSGKLVSCHHPFTAPIPQHLDLVLKNPTEAKSQHYDLVLNGCEVAGGSVRIHDAQLQLLVLQILDIDPDPLSFLIDALSSGAPPHGGIALGFDRYVSLLCGSKNIKEVIAFPKSSEGRCLMSGAPSTISKEDKEMYHIQTS